MSLSTVRRAFLWTVATMFAFGGAAHAQEDLFPRPKELEPAVQFWTRVYTEVDTHSGFIHDDLHLDIVYQTVRFSDDMSQRDRRRRVERALELQQNILNKLGGGARQSLNSEEQRVLALFPEGTSNEEFRAAVGRLRFQLGQSDRFRTGLVRAGAWKPYIYDVLDKEGLPRELASLPHVESSFDPTAYSKVGAAGLWQFTRSTGVRYMRIDHIVDERRDPFMATKAAARLLADNHSVVETWPLALTAYNHGLAGMRRAADTLRTTDIATVIAKYQSRSFGFASRNFYAAFLAALAIDQDPERYFEHLRVDPPSSTGIVAVPAFMHADKLADALSVRFSTLRSLNPALSDAVWSGDKFVPEGFELRVPEATAAVAEELMAAIKTNDRFGAQRADQEHKVRGGDTLSQIAAEYRVSLAALMRINGFTASDMLRVGQTIRLPTEAVGGATVAAAAANVTATAVVARAEPAARKAPAPAIATTDDGAQVYVVRSGDSIERIAKNTGVDAGALLAANSIRDKNLIFAGQTLALPSQDATATVAANADIAPESTDDTADETLGTADLTAALAPAVGRKRDAVQPEPAGVFEDATNNVNALSTEQAVLAADPTDYSVSTTNQITVQALETLGHFADWAGVPTQRLRELNKLRSNEAVAIGKKITLDMNEIDAATFEQRRVAYHQQQQSDFFASHQIETIETHVIKSGESLWVLAERKYKVPVWLLRQYNPDLNFDRVQPGAVVKFPRLKAVAAGVAANPPQSVAASGR
ncbi:MAG: LysM peptidoglycan-binding domain-containing protein [Gammaproteobacteria bacterium]